MEYEEGTSLFDVNKSELIKFKDDIYQDLSLDEKLELVQLVVNIECCDLGIALVQVAAKCLCDRNLNGYYSPGDKVIVIDTHVLEGVYGVQSLISSVLHETYHLYEVCCVELVDLSHISDEAADLRWFRDVVSWKDELNDYQDSGDLASLEAYKNQKLEIRANEYSNTWTRVYNDYINSIELDEYQGD